MTSTTNLHGLPEDGLLPRDTRRSMAIMLLRARESVMSGYRPVLARHDLSEPQWRVMRVLGEVEKMDSREVAERACVLAPSLTRIVRALEQRGLVTRDRRVDDGRRIFLAITPAGVALIRQMTREGSQAFDRLRTRYGVERWEALLDMLTDLTDVNR